MIRAQARVIDPQAALKIEGFPLGPRSAPKMVVRRFFLVAATTTPMKYSRENSRVEDQAGVDLPARK